MPAKLTDPQHHALHVLAGEPSRWYHSGYRAMRTNTLEALELLGLCTVRIRLGATSGFTEARITTAGIQAAQELEQGQAGTHESTEIAGRAAPSEGHRVQ